MAQRTLHDGSTGDVVIRSGPPASGGVGGWGGGIGGGGGNRVGASGNFGGVSRRTAALRKAAKRERAEKAARDQAEAARRARVQARQQALAGLVQRHNAVRVELDQAFATKIEKLTLSLEQEISAAQQPPVHNPSERWQLYLITKEKNEIDGLINRKTAELGIKHATALSFDGHDPLTRTEADYRARLEQFGEALNSGHQTWENAYNAAHEAQWLATQINALAQKSNDLAKHHAEQSVIWREREAQQERHRLQAEQRDARIRFKQQADADTRLERVKQANTLHVPIAQSTMPGGLLPSHGGEWGHAQKLVAAATRASILTYSVLSTVTRPQVAVFMAGMLVPTRELGNGELTPEQRNRLYEAVVIPAHALEFHDSEELHDAASTGASVEAEYRLKPVATPEGTAIIVASTGGEIASRVSVVSAVLDPLTGVYTAVVPGAPTRYVEFSPDAMPDSASGSQPRLMVTEPQIQDIPAGVDLRIQDCIVCVPGLEPLYLSFNVPPMGAGVVTGTGQPATLDWWKAASQPQGAAIPSEIGDQFRGRQFKSFDAFDKAFWQTLGEQRVLISGLDDINKKRVEQGFAPYAPKSTWVGEFREFELRYEQRPEFWTDPFNLDKISIKTPDSTAGWVGIVPAVVPWAIPPASSWKPLVPPGSEYIDSTASPITSTDPLIYPGSPAVPVLPPNQTFPAVDEGEIGASIPGFPGDMELPSPDALFRDRRDDPGVATGAGRVVSGVWLGDAARGDGAPVPLQIADQLRGKEFANFHRFREAFWKAVAADASLRQQFSVRNLSRMMEGLAPYPQLADQLGGRKTFELHHDVKVSSGGDVYGVDNILVMTPRRHIQLHKESNHDL